MFKGGHHPKKPILLFNCRRALDEVLVRRVLVAVDGEAVLTTAGGSFFWTANPETTTFTATISPEPVPEPATLTLTGLGLAGIVTRYHRRRSRSES